MGHGWTAYRLQELTNVSLSTASRIRRPGIRPCRCGKRMSRRVLISLFEFLEVRLQGYQRYKRLADEFPLKENVVEQVSGF
jgi:hypothetical protein